MSAALRKDAVLFRASEIINGVRAKDYGDAAESFARVAAGWSLILNTAVEGHHVALCMDWLKTCRLIQSPAHFDSWVDKAGYSALGCEVAGQKQP